MAYLAIDVGGTKLAAGVVDADGTIVHRDRVPTPRRDPWRGLVTLVDRVQASSPVPLVACGVGCAGPMTPGGEEVSPLNIPTWQDFPLRRLLAEHTGLPTFVDGDAKALALGEGWCGAAVGERHYLAMVVSTGIGAGIVVDGALLHGRLGNAGHLGHTVVEPDGEPCPGCGGRGCLEAYAGGLAVERLTGTPPSHANQATITRCGMLVGRALSSACAALGIRLALVSGSVALGWKKPFFAAAQAVLDERRTWWGSRPAVVRPAGLGEQGPLVGAAAVARAAEHATVAGSGQRPAPPAAG
jgi:glucokinase